MADMRRCNSVRHVEYNVGNAVWGDKIYYNHISNSLVLWKAVASDKFYVQQTKPPILLSLLTESKSYSTGGFPVIHKKSFNGRFQLEELQ